jgi:hypothetical protein
VLIENEEGSRSKIGNGFFYLAHKMNVQEVIKHFMRSRFFLLLLLLGAFTACKKYEMGYPPAPTPPPPPAPAPAPPALLKDLVLSSLPSPYYHFEYDLSGKVNFASFASDFTRYDIKYSNGMISEMRNNILVNKDRLQYFYNNAGKVEAITYADSTGKVYKKVELFYNGDKLVKLERTKKINDEFVKEKTTSLSYYTDGNLSDVNYHFLLPSESSYTLHYEQYDNKVNVDGFSILHDEFFDHFFLLPGVQVQKNNPGKETLLGAVDNYTVDYTYTYSDKNVPLNRSGDLVVTSGVNVGKRFHLSASYSYY